MGLGIALGIRGVGWSTQSQRRSSERDRKRGGVVYIGFIYRYRKIRKEGIALRGWWWWVSTLVHYTIRSLYKLHTISWGELIHLNLNLAFKIPVKT